MKTPVLVVVTALVVAGAGGGIVYRQSAAQAARMAQAQREQEAKWQAEKADLEAELAAALARGRGTTTIVDRTARLSAAEIMTELERLSTGGSAPRNLRLAAYWLEELLKVGPSARPTVRDYVARDTDFDLDGSWFERGRGWRDRLPGEFALPPSLRLGLLDVVRQLGGPESEKLLAGVLPSTRRGLELAFVTRVLHDLSPGKYRDAALAAARARLAEGSPPKSGSRLDRFHRDHLYSVLAFYGDSSYQQEAQNQLVKNDGIDRGAIAYLGKTLGPGVVAVAARAYGDARVPQAGAKEPLVRAALDYVGTDPHADELWQQAIDDPSMPPEYRQNLIEDLNENGFPDPENPTPSDLPLIERRIALIEKLQPKAMDAVNAAGFKEAYKDLVEMRSHLAAPAAAR